MSGTAVTPPWLKEEGYNSPTSSSGYTAVPLASSYVPPQPPGVPAPVPQQLPSPLPAKLSTILFSMKITTILLCILMDITAIIGIGKSNIYFIIPFFIYISPTALQHQVTLIKWMKLENFLWLHICFSSALCYWRLKL